MYEQVHSQYVTHVQIHIRICVRHSKGAEESLVAGSSLALWYLCLESPAGASWVVLVALSAQLLCSVAAKHAKLKGGL